MRVRTRMTSSSGNPALSLMLAGSDEDSDKSNAMTRKDSK